MQREIELQEARLHGVRSQFELGQEAEKAAEPLPERTWEALTCPSCR